MKSLLILLVTASSVLGHQGHDHHDHEDDNNDIADIPETDSEWARPEIHSTKLKGVLLKWKQDPSDPKYVVLKMAARTSGYVAVGFCPTWSNGMANCDIVLGWVDGAGSHLHDYFAKANGLPELDLKQDYKLISATETNGITSIVFRRLWDTGDDEKDANLEHNSNVHIIYAWSNVDPNSERDFQKHEYSERGHTQGSIAIKNHQHSGAMALVGSNIWAFSTAIMSTVLWYL